MTEEETTDDNDELQELPADNVEASEVAMEVTEEDTSDENDEL